MTFTSSGGMQHAADLMARPVSAAARHVYGKLQSSGALRATHLLIWLCRVFVLPAALYGCQVWSTLFMSLLREPKAEVCRRLVGVFRQCLQVKHSTPAWSAYREVGCFLLVQACDEVLQQHGRQQQCAASEGVQG